MDMLTYAWIVDSALCSFDDASVLNPNLTCTDNGSFTATLSVDDGVNPAVTSDATVEVANVDPTIDAAITGPAAPVAIDNQTFAVGATFSDVGTSDTHDVTWDWGDSTSDTENNASNAASMGHVYADPGVYKVTVTVTDDDGGTATETFEYVVVYDPSAGFVTGGGWIMSPAGAYSADPTLTGKASFGFVAKYKRGQSTPDGNTQFQFKAGNLNFHSTSYEWLVVAGANAKFRGVGTINGQGTYTFMITATDGNLLGGGQSDGFRIKIWDAGGVVYDNKMGEGDDSNATTDLGGGSIVIHNR
jgi:PKD repeat protein